MKPILDSGSCPVCGKLVPRLLSARGNATVETYECPKHGSVSYGGGASNLSAWVSSLEGPWGTPLEIPWA